MTRDSTYYARYAFMAENPDSPLTRKIRAGCHADDLHVKGVPALIHAIRESLTETSIEALVLMGCNPDELFRDPEGNAVTPLTEAVAASRYGDATLRTVRFLSKLSSETKIGWAAELASSDPEVPPEVRWFLTDLAKEVHEPPYKVHCANPSEGVHWQGNAPCIDQIFFSSMSM